MVITFAGRPSDSPYIEQVWCSRSDEGGRFVSVAEGRLELVVSRLPGLTMVSLRGPETQPTMMDCPLQANGSPSASGRASTCRSTPSRS